MTDPKIYGQCPECGTDLEFRIRRRAAFLSCTAIGCYWTGIDCVSLPDDIFECFKQFSERLLGLRDFWMEKCSELCAKEEE